MTLDLPDCAVSGPVLAEPFLRHELGPLLARKALLPAPGKPLEAGWGQVRRQLRALGGEAGPLLVCRHVIVPLAAVLGYLPPERREEVATREGVEDGGWLLSHPGGAALRVWTVAAGTDLDVPHRRGRAYRFSAPRGAQRVLFATGERIGLLSNGDELRLLLCDPVRSDSQLSIALAGGTGWRERPLPPDSYRLLLALVSPPGLAALPGILEAARLYQSRITEELRLQARLAVEGFTQALLDHPPNRGLAPDPELPARLWEEGLILIYRLLFILKLESSSEPGRSFSFASTGLWRSALSPQLALAPLVRRHLDHGHDTGRMLEDGLRTLFRVFRDGLSCASLSIAPLGGALFGAETTPTLDGLAWGERAVALLLDCLLWTTSKAPGKSTRKSIGKARERVHYGSLDVEDLGRVYEALLELEPGIAGQKMVRLRRARREVVVPATRGDVVVPATRGDVVVPATRGDVVVPATRGNLVVPATRGGVPVPVMRGETLARATRPVPGGAVEHVEDIPAGRFFLRAGLGRKATGSYYTPHEFVRFLVRETLGPQIETRSPAGDPDPAALLALKIVDPAVGSGHFLVEACRFLGEALYLACRHCDDLATAATRAGDRARADVLRARVSALPDTALAAYLPSRCHAAGTSPDRALAICRRLVAVHCLYGVDRNRMAVELAKLSLWLESHAEGLPLTFLDHRLIVGDSLSGPFFPDLATLPVGGGPLDPLLARGVAERLDAARAAAMAEVAALEASIGRDVADVAAKAAAKRRLDAVLAPLRQLARAWSGAVMLNRRDSDDEWLAVASAVAATGAWPGRLSPRAAELLAAGDTASHGALPWDLTFPEVFARGGFDAVLGNPPWDTVQHKTRDFVAGFDLSVLDEPEALARTMAEPGARDAFAAYRETFDHQKRLAQRLFRHQRATVGKDTTAGNLDLFRLFAERCVDLLGPAGAIGLVLPAAFHANEGATAIRQLYFRETALDICLSFENRRKLFDIDSRFRFDLIVARRPGPTRSMRCAFQLETLDQAADPERIMTYDAGFITAAGGDHLTPLELRGPGDLAVARTLFADHMAFGNWCASRGIRFGRDLHMTDDAALFHAIGRASGPGMLPLHEGKTFHQFTDRWDTVPRYVVPREALAAKPSILAASARFRLAFRDIAHATNEHTMIAAIMPPGVVFGHTATVERAPHRRPDRTALVLCAILNSHPFDWMVRLKAGTHLSLYIVEGLPMPALDTAAEGFLAEGALRLCANHAAYAALWREQTGRRWTPDVPIADQGARWRLRAAMDAVVARAYGLDRAAYQRVLAGFTHRSFPNAPRWCLEAFDNDPPNRLMAGRPNTRGRDVPATNPEPVALLAPSRAVNHQ
jgi:hypothetical protein